MSMEDSTKSIFPGSKGAMDGGKFSRSVFVESFPSMFVRSNGSRGFLHPRLAFFLSGEARKRGYFVEKVFEGDSLKEYRVYWRGKT